MKTNRLRIKNLFTISILITLGVLLAVALQPDTLPGTIDTTGSIQGESGNTGSVLVPPVVKKTNDTVIINGVAITDEHIYGLQCQ